MRDYSKVSAQFWIGNTGRKIRKLGSETQLIALYLMTCPSSTMIGIYYLPVHFISHETGIPLQGACKGLVSLSEVGFCSYDAELEYVWVHEMAFYQVGGQLKPGDNRIKGINDAYKNLPNLLFLSDFYERYQHIFYLKKKRSDTSPLQAPCKPLASQEQEQEQEQEQKKKDIVQTKDISDLNIILPPLEKSSGKQSRKKQLSENFIVTDSHRELAVKNQWPSPDNEIEAFRDHHLSRGNSMLDWDRAFYTWLRNAKKYSKTNQGGNYGHRQSAGEIHFDSCKDALAGTPYDTEANLGAPAY